MIIREIAPNETWFLKEMLYEALFIPECQPKLPKTIVDDPALSKYIENWGKDDLDVGIVAEHNGDLMGAIWGRVFSIDKKGYGFVDEETPELSMAVNENHRGKGIGTALLEAVAAAYQRKGIKALSLSVDKQNPAFKLYKRAGFEIVLETETSVTMKKQLN